MTPENGCLGCGAATQRESTSRNTRNGMFGLVAQTELLAYRIARFWERVDRKQRTKPL